jgi:hypothetical protein
MVIGFRDELYTSGFRQIDERLQYIRTMILKLLQTGTGDRVGDLEFSFVPVNQFQHLPVRLDVTLLTDLIEDQFVLFIIFIEVIFSNIEEGISFQAKRLMYLEVEAD